MVFWVLALWRFGLGVLGVWSWHGVVLVSFVEWFPLWVLGVGWCRELVWLAFGVLRVVALSHDAIWFWVFASWVGVVLGPSVMGWGGRGRGVVWFWVAA